MRLALLPLLVAGLCRSGARRTVVLDAHDYAGQDGGQRVAAAVAALGPAGGTVKLSRDGPDDVTIRREGRLAHPERGKKAWGFAGCVRLPSRVTIELNGAYLFQTAAGLDPSTGAPLAAAQGFFISERWGGPPPANASELAFYVKDEHGRYTWPLYLYDVPGRGRSKKVYFSQAVEQMNELPADAELFLSLEDGHEAAATPPPGTVPAFAERWNVDIAILGQNDALLESNADYWYEHGVCVHKPCDFGPGSNPTKEPLLSSDVGSQVLRMGNVVGLTIRNITLSRTGGWATFFRDTARVTVSGFRVVSGYRDGYHIYGMAINHSVTDYHSQLRDNNIALLGDRVHARNIVFRRVSMRNERVDPIRLDVYQSNTWAASNLIHNLSFFQVDNYENGHGDPFVMLGHVNADVDPNEPKLVDISFTNVRIHNNASAHQAQDAFRLVQPVRNLRLTDVSILAGASQAMRDVSHQILPNFTAGVKLVDGLQITRMRMHRQASAIQLGHSLPPSFANNSYTGVVVDGTALPCVDGCSCDFDAHREIHCRTFTTTSSARKSDDDDAPVGSNRTTFCNPVDLGYRLHGKCRAAADFTLVPWKGSYWLFTTDTQGGYWHSHDLVSWSLVTYQGLPDNPTAPHAFVSNGTMFYTCINCAFYSTTDPATARWANLGGAGHFPDPMLLVDEATQRWYMYSGCSPSAPGDMKTTELDPHNGFKPVGTAHPGVVPDPSTRGFEVPGDLNNLTANKPYIEGSWVTERNGTYYWQYAAPGTQYKTYADGIFTASSPTGPWTYAAVMSPASHKPTGFLGGVGHSSTFEDLHGQTWHISTASIDVRDSSCGHFERRAAMHPLRWLKSGGGQNETEVMAVDTYLGDFPQLASGEGMAGWMLLSYNKSANVSSSLSAHPPALALNEDIRTWWSAASGSAGEWFRVDLGQSCEIRAVQTNFADQDINHDGVLTTSSYQYKIETSVDGETWKVVLTRGAPTPPPPPSAPITDAHRMAGGGAICSAKNFSSGVCLHNAYPIIRSFQTSEPAECCGNCTADPKCISWNINTGMKECFLRASWKPNPGAQCISGQVRDVKPPPPAPPDHPHDYAELPGPGTEGGTSDSSPIHARHVRITNAFMPGGAKFSLSGLRVFGRCPGVSPAVVAGIEAVRDPDRRKVHVSWSPAAGAEWYIIRYGTGKDRLFGNYQVYGATSYTIASLNVGTSYYVTVDSIGSTGLTKGRVAVAI